MHHPAFDADFDEPINWKLEEARFDMAGFDELEPWAETADPCLVPPANKFIVNLGRVRSMHDAVVDIASMAMFYQEARCNVLHSPLRNAPSDQIQAEIHKQIQDRVEMWKRDQSLADKDTQIQQER